MNIFEDKCLKYKSKYLKYKSKYLKYKNNLELINLHGGKYNKSDDIIINYIREKALKISQEFNSKKLINTYKPDSIFYGLNISMHFTDIQTIYDKYNYIQLRPYQGEIVLVFGCGNRRIDTANIEETLHDFKSINEKRNYDIYHSHYNEFTIDITITANPSIIANVNDKSTFPTIPDHSFKLIYFEGGASNKINVNEIKRLLNNKTCSFCIVMNEGIYYTYSYYLEGKFFIKNDTGDRFHVVE